jgi:hypothetical protein
MKATNPFKLSAIVCTASFNIGFLTLFVPPLTTLELEFLGTNSLEFAVTVYLLTFVWHCFVWVELSPQKELNFYSFKGLGLSEKLTTSPCAVYNELPKKSGLIL